MSGCEGQERIRTAFPPAVDLSVEAKPAITPEVLTSDISAAQYDSDLEAWGERGWAAIARVCNWAKSRGMKIECKTE